MKTKKSKTSNSTDAKRIKSKLSKAQKQMLLGPTRNTTAHGRPRVALLVDPDAWKTRNALKLRGLVTGRLFEHDDYGFERVLLTPLGEKVRAIL